MSKIQILNENEVQHLYEAFVRELDARFQNKVTELESLAEQNKDNFSSHEKIVKQKIKDEERIKAIQYIYTINEQIKEVLGDGYKISGPWMTTSYATQAEVDELIKEQAGHIEELKYDIARESLFVDSVYQRRNSMHSDLLAILALTSVDNYESIKERVLSMVDINSYFISTILKY